MNDTLMAMVRAFAIVACALEPDQARKAAAELQAIDSGFDGEQRMFDRLATDLERWADEKEQAV